LKKNTQTHNGVIGGVESLAMAMAMAIMQWVAEVDKIIIPDEGCKLFVC
jgi:hypothetical protein